MRVRDAARPEAVIAYSKARLASPAEATGLTVERILPGYWIPGEDAAVNEQDLVVFRRR